MTHYAVIIGAGPAGLTAALELLRHTEIKPIIIETLDDVGGISRTINHNGNRMDIGGHRFFSKSDWVMDWWREILPVESFPTETDIEISYQNQKKTLKPNHSIPLQENLKHFLIRKRLSRIYFLRKFFDYPIKLNLNTLKNLGVLRIIKIVASYVYIRVFPRKPERNLADFIINRFGNSLYLTFFKHYTEKVWGVPCEKINPNWGAQRIKALSISQALWHAVKKLVAPKVLANQKNTATSLIEQFLYPALGPGQLWQEVAQKIVAGGGEIIYHSQVIGLSLEDHKVARVSFKNLQTQQVSSLEADYVLSTMPVKDLIESLGSVVPDPVQKIARALPYRDFITVGLLLKRMLTEQPALNFNGMPPDNWIYIQEHDVKVGRLQVFNNWSPHLVKDPETIWLGMEYFCLENDALWSLSDQEFVELAAQELIDLNLLESKDLVLDYRVVRVTKAYPAYFGAYHDFEYIREYVDSLENLFLIGRNGMHRYNNQDHSMLTARLAVQNIKNQCVDKANLWAVNVDDDYHEQK